MRIAVVVGVRPQFVKVAPLLRTIRDRHVVRLIHTGQHYDHDLSKQFFDELEIPRPDVHLDVRAESRLSRVAQTLTALEPHFVGPGQPDLVMVLGDSDPALTGGLAAAVAGVAVAHVEAGLRSSDLGQVEERNRRIIDALSILNFAPSRNCWQNLVNESAAGPVFAGDLHLDAVRNLLPVAEGMEPVSGEFDLAPGSYYLITAHRRDLFDRPELLPQLVDLLRSLQAPCLWPIHPGVLAELHRRGLADTLAREGNVRLIAPLSHARLLSLVLHARLTLTDSGGLQREAYFLRRRSVILRSSTEFPETIVDANAVLAGSDPDLIRRAVTDLSADDRPVNVDLDQFGGGTAAARIAAELDRYALRLGEP